MKRVFSTTRLPALTLAAGLLSVSLALADHKPGHGGGEGGGGGGDSFTYTIVKLDDAGGTFVGSPSSEASDINEPGHVVGSVAEAATGASIAAFWEVNGTSSRIVPLTGGRAAFGLNNFHEIVGVGSASSNPPLTAGLYWSSPSGAVVALPPLSEGLATVAYAINDSGVICGFAVQPVLDEQGTTIGSTHVAVVWRATHVDGDLQVDGPYPLPTFDDRSQAYAVSESDGSGVVSVVGVFMTAGFARTAAVEWTIQLNDDGTLGVDPNPAALEIGEGAVALGVNNTGWRCGQARQGIVDKARVWIGGDGFTLLNPDAQPQTLERTYHRARDVNDAGVIVGAAAGIDQSYAAVVWPGISQKPLLLHKFLPKRNAPFIGLKEATAINEAGTIVGIGLEGFGYPFLAVRN